MGAELATGVMHRLRNGSQAGFDRWRLRESFAGRFRHSLKKIRPKPVVPCGMSLAFTLAPHLQRINHRGRFSPFGGI
jgi:hypothetical protein